jgi:primosomal protein N' (replication factor Y) (superfamily II helicase)
MTGPEARYADVAIPVPLGMSFGYRVPARFTEPIVPGSRVLCPFGSRKVLGVVLGVSDEPPAIDATKIRELVAVLDAEPVLPEELLGFIKQLAGYYFAPIGEVFRLALPAVERDRVTKLEQQGMLLPGEAMSRSRQVTGGRVLTFAQATDALEEPGSLRGQAQAVLSLLRGAGEMAVPQIVERYGNARAALKKLETAGLVRIEKRRVAKASPFDVEPERDAPPELNDAQREAVTRITAALADEVANKAFLLFGVTGSGKTEVYMHAIAEVLERGRGALVLVPEIALTPQLVGRFRARFGHAIAVLHSGLAEGERHAMWQRLRDGELRVAVGARSALFAPVPELGLIVVDEEHDGSFKQEEGVRYHARDMALLRGHRVGAAVVLGSATPSLESVALSKRGKLEAVYLPERATAATMPVVEIVDLKRVGPGPSNNRMISLPLHRALDATLEAGEQAIIFLNRRGFAPAVVCHACGVVASCAQCSVALTYHRRAGGRLRCHYCDFSSMLPARCPSCDAPGALELEGVGTEKLESAIADAFPNARVGRLDRDVAAGAKSEKVIARMRRREIDVLVGTQMVTKGHDLPEVTLVGVVNADAALSMPDFRAAERGFQLLVQVAGRAGRHEKKGKVLIQTRSPKHAAIRFAKQHDVHGFLAHELNDRREVGYPPFSRIALVRVSAVDEEVARRSAGRLAAHARSSPEASRGLVEVLGPAAAPIARLRNRYRFRVFLRGEQRPALRRVIAALHGVLGDVDRKARVVIDIDPVSML